MKNYLFLAILITSISAFADDTSNGCGLGWKVTTKTSLLASSVRQTTNTYLPNSFSMTSGTSGCGAHSIVKKSEEPAVLYAASNKDALILDISQGEGVYLTAFFKTMGCKSATEFSHATRSHFSEILKQSERSGLDFYLEIKNALQIKNVKCEVSG